MEEMEKQEDLVISAPQKESDIKMWYESITYEDAKVFIKTNIISAARSFIAIGFYLKCVRDKELFQEDGHASIWDFASAEYGLSKSTASRYMTMNDRFSKDGNSPVIAEPYKDFGKSQLQEMLSLNEEQLEQITPGSTVQEIRGMRAPKEIPYFEMEGQMDLTDFPEVLPESMQQPFPETTPLSQQSQSFVFDVSELFQGQDEAIAISQYPEQEDGYQYEREEQPPTITESKPETVVIDGEFEEVKEKPKQPELPLLKNNDQRATFVDAYETWPLWIETEETGERYYRYDLSDGTSMVVKVYHAKIFDYSMDVERWENRYREGWGRHEYYLLREGEFFKDCETNRSQLIEKLKEVQKKGK